MCTNNEKIDLRAFSDRELYLTVIQSEELKEIVFHENYKCIEEVCKRYLFTDEQFRRLLYALGIL